MIINDPNWFTDGKVPTPLASEQITGPAPWKFCPVCGHELGKGWTHCSKCWNEIGKDLISECHEHQWIELTCFGDSERSYICSGCPASRAEPLYPLQELMPDFSFDDQVLSCGLHPLHRL